MAVIQKAEPPKGCPNPECGANGDNINCHDSDNDGDVEWRGYYCNRCECEWSEYYSLQFDSFSIDEPGMTAEQIAVKAEKEALQLANVVGQDAVGVIEINFDNPKPWQVNIETQTYETVEEFAEGVLQVVQDNKFVVVKGPDGLYWQGSSNIMFGGNYSGVWVDSYGNGGKKTAGVNINDRWIARGVWMDLEKKQEAIAKIANALVHDDYEVAFRDPGDYTFDPHGNPNYKPPKDKALCYRLKDDGGWKLASLAGTCLILPLKGDARAVWKVS